MSDLKSDISSSKPHFRPGGVYSYQGGVDFFGEGCNSPVYAPLSAIAQSNRIKLDL